MVTHKFTYTAIAQYLNVGIVKIVILFEFNQEK